MDDDEGNDVLPNYEMYRAEGDLHLKKGLLAKAVDCYTKVVIVKCQYYQLVAVGLYACLFPRVRVGLSHRVLSLVHVQYRRPT